MAGFTEEEIRAELERRTRSQSDFEAKRKDAERARQLSGTACIHCGLTKVHPWSQAADHNLCDDCLDKD